MAETLLSPGVLARENDQSFIGARPVTFGAAIIGPATKGPVGIPTAVSTFSQYEAIFGSSVESGSQFYTYLNSISARNYFAQGGESLLVTRVVTGSFLSANSAIPSSLTDGTLATGENVLLSSFTSAGAFNVTGSTGNAVIPNISPTTDGAGASAVFTVKLATQTAVSITSSISSIEVTTMGTGYEVGDTLTFTSQSLGATVPAGTDATFTLTASDLNATASFTIKTISEGANMNNYQAVDSANGTLNEGTAENIRWEVASVNTASGQFSLLVRRGNDTVFTDATSQKLLVTRIIQ